MRRGIMAAVLGVLLAAGAPGDAADAKKPGGLRGSWTAMSAERNGVPADDIKGHRLTFSGDRFTIRSKGKLRYQGTFRIDPSKIPALAEPWFLTFNADVELRVAMTPEDLARAGLEALGKKWA